MPLSASDYIVTEEESLTKKNTASESSVRIPFGIKQVDDRFIMGVEPDVPGIYLFQGGPGMRKTTLLLNIILNQCMSGRLPGGHKIYWWSIETSMTVERVALKLRAMLASKILIHMAYHSHVVPWEDLIGELSAVTDWTDNWGGYTNAIIHSFNMAKELFSYQITESPGRVLSSVSEVVGGRQRPLLEITPDLVKAQYNLKSKGFSPLQYSAWHIAGHIMRLFPIIFYGPSEHADHKIRRERSSLTDDPEYWIETWHKLAEEHYGNAQFVMDHGSALKVHAAPGANLSYERQVYIAPRLSEFARKYSVLNWIIMQEGVGHQREFRTMGRVLGSEGGDLIFREADVVWRPEYHENSQPNYMILYRPQKTRRASHPDLALPIEPNSGVLYGVPRLKNEVFNK